MWRDPDEVLNQNGDIHVLTLMPFPTPSHTFMQRLPSLTIILSLRANSIKHLTQIVLKCHAAFTSWNVEGS